MKNLFEQTITIAFAFFLLLPDCIAQKTNISGTVSSSDGPLPGATLSAGTVNSAHQRAGTIFCFSQSRNAYP